MLWLNGDELLVSQHHLHRAVCLDDLQSPPPARPTPTALAGTSPADFSDMEVVREFATSKDGTKVPLNIIRRKGTKLDGKNPTLLYGYGGYGISLYAQFQLPAAHLARPGRRLRGGQPARRRRVRRGMAQGRQPDPQAERLRRLRRLRRSI